MSTLPIQNVLSEISEMEHEQAQKLLSDLHIEFPFLASKVVPLAHGCGDDIRNALVNLGHDHVLVDQFTNEYFFRTEYRVSIINAIDDPERRRFNLDGSVSDSKVSERDLYALAFVRKVYLDANISPAAKAYCRKEQGKVLGKKEKLKSHTRELCQLGFSHLFILSKLGKKVDSYLVSCDLSSFKDIDVDSARKLGSHSSQYSKKKIRGIQDKLMGQGVPVQLINLASGDYQDYIYSRLFSHPKQRKQKKSKKSKTSNDRRTRNGGVSNAGNRKRASEVA